MPILLKLIYKFDTISINPNNLFFPEIDKLFFQMYVTCQKTIRTPRTYLRGEKKNKLEELHSPISGLTVEQQ